ncbi:MAG: permease, partial [Enterocloster aldenensis]
MLIAGLIFNIFPSQLCRRIWGIRESSLFWNHGGGRFMYVCAVGHIPFIAALVASGAAPGVAITFLMAGASTNIPELLTINRTIGKRAMIMYFFMVTVISNIVGYITNQLLMPGFKPVLDYDASQKTIRAANKLIFTAPLWLKYLCSFV